MGCCVTKASAIDKNKSSATDGTGTTTDNFKKPVDPDPDKKKIDCAELSGASYSDEESDSEEDSEEESPIGNTNSDSAPGKIKLNLTNLNQKHHHHHGKGKHQVSAKVGKGDLLQFTNAKGLKLNSKFGTNSSNSLKNLNNINNDD